MFASALDVLCCSRVLMVAGVWTGHQCGRVINGGIVWLVYDT